MTVPFSSIAVMVTDIVIGILIPLCVSIYLKKKYNAKFKTFFVGVFTFVIFAYGLETLMHNLILSSSIGQTIVGNIYFYALYGGLAAALFEEGGRFLAFRYILKDEKGDDSTALMYGAGHGGIEIILIMVAGMISNLIFTTAINNGSIYDMIAPLDADQQAAYYQTITTLCTTPSWFFLLVLWERLSAFVAHMCMSLLVFRAVRDNNNLYLLISFMFHLLLNASAVIFQNFVANYVAVEIFITVVVIIMVVITLKLVPLKLNRDEESVVRKTY